VIKRWSIISILFLLVLSPISAQGAASPADVWSRWSLNPVIIFALFVAAWMYGRGLISINDQASVLRCVPLWRTGAFVAGIVMLIVSFHSPLNALANTLFSAHMTQVVLLFAVAPLLLMLGEPGYVYTWSIPITWRWKVGRIFRNRPSKWLAMMFRKAAVVWTLHTLVLWLWHVPDLYDLTLRSPFFQTVAQILALTVALLYWRLVILCMQHRTSGALLLASVIQTSILGALMTFSPAPWNALHTFYVEVWGLTVLGDQQLGGLMLWLPMLGVYLTAALFATRKSDTSPVPAWQWIRNTAR
jgi:putative membrane protein